MNKIKFTVKNDGDTLLWAEKFGVAQEAINGMITLDKVHREIEEPTTYTIHDVDTDKLILTYEVDANGDVNVTD